MDLKQANPKENEKQPTLLTQNKKGVDIQMTRLRKI
jgi:hypothetical protein